MEGRPVEATERPADGSAGTRAEIDNSIRDDHHARPAQDNQDEGADDDEQSTLKEWIGLLVRAGVWALLIYVLLFQISIVDGDSMNPTFHHGDRLFIDKLTYRLAGVRRSDVIVFETIDLARDLKERRPKDYIKRVIGLPGETVEIYDGNVWIDGRKSEDRFGPTFANTLHDARRKQTVVVPPRMFFVMGDNRDFSKDSRVDDTRGGARQSLGFVPQGQIRGLVRLRFWPWNDWHWFGRQ